MINTSFDEEKLSKRWLEFWNRENEDRPLLATAAGKENAHRPPVPTGPKDVKDRWLDTEFQVKCARYGAENTVFLGEAFPIYSPNLGPDFLGAVCGCDLKFSPSTSWAEPCIEDYESFPDIVFDEKNPWWQKMVEMTKAALDDANGDYIVGITDIHPGADAVVSLRGADVAAMDLYLEPEEFKKRVWQIFDVFKEVTGRLNGIITEKQKGSSNWMYLYHPEKLWYVTSCDFSYMISSEHYKEFILPELIAEAEWLPATVYHLDGVGSLTHLDTLLELDRINGIQWVPGEGKPPAREWIEVLKKIQRAGKNIVMSCYANDIIPLCEALDPRGVSLTFGGLDRDSADSLIKEAERVCRKKRATFAI
ncbi:MAG: trimethylamine corrinoid protein 2 [Clostridia bacterium]|nr:trimethylamine corrinoid protein 2 [Clostridia bacterium]